MPRLVNIVIVLRLVNIVIMSCYFVQAGDYADIEELVTDFNLMFDNAQQYNIEDSKIFKVSFQNDISIKDNTVKSGYII